MARMTTRGSCALCGYKSNKAGMTRHLKTCPQAYDGSRGRSARLFHLRIEDAESPLYWLDLEVKRSARLAELDGFLRGVWLECCGHLSMFKIGNAHYNIDDDFGDEVAGDDEDTLEAMLASLPAAERGMLEKILSNRAVERGMNTRLEDALNVGTVFSHEYDFGSTTYLKLKVVGEREGRVGRDPLRLLARNDAPAWECAVCGAQATQVNTEELWEEGNPFYCDEHAEGEEWVFLPVVNSPRMGVCGYTGPDE